MNTTNRRLRQSDPLVMKMAKRPVRVTGGHVDLSRIIRGETPVRKAFASLQRVTEDGDTRTLMDRLIDGDLEYLGQMRVKR